MSAWRVAQHYGFGAAKIPIQPEPHRARSTGLREGFADYMAEVSGGGAAAAARAIVAGSPVLILCALIFVSFFVTMRSDHSDISAIEVVLFADTPPAIEEKAEPIPEPAPVVAGIPKPIERVAPKPVAAPKPVEQIAEVVKPPPAVLKPDIRKPRVMPEMARVEKPLPKLLPVERPDRVVRPKAMKMTKPRVALVSPQPVAESLTERPVNRTHRLARNSPRLRMDAPRIEVNDSKAPMLSSENPTRRGFRVAAASNAPRARVPRISPTLAPPSPGPAALTSSMPSSTHREDRRPQVLRARRSPRPSAEMDRQRAFGAPVPTPTPIVQARVERTSQPNASQGAVRSRPGLSGVPLAELAVCLDDRDEDRLKQAVVAAVTTQKECVSRIGTYRFVETKNLNSFLMWIDRDSSGSAGDRCDELRHALECLDSARQHAAR